jgi:hypothetical protein
MTTEEMFQVANDAYQYIRDNTTGPRDGAQVVLMIHVLLWLNHKDDSTTTDKMLEDYCSDFRCNYDQNYKRHLNA